MFLFAGAYKGLSTLGTIWMHINFDSLLDDAY